MFSLYYHNTAAPRLAQLANRAASRYDLVFVCDVDIPYDDTLDCSGDVNRRIFQKQIVNDLILRKIPFFLVQGELETRVQYVKIVQFIALLYVILFFMAINGLISWNKSSKTPEDLAG